MTPEPNPALIDAGALVDAMLVEAEPGRRRPAGSN